MNNNDNNNDDNFYKIMAYVFIGLFLLAIICFLCSLILSCLKIKNYLKIYMLIINYKIDIESLQMKNKYYYDCDDIIIYDFDFDIGLVKIFKREPKLDVNIYYIGYKPDIDDTISPLYFFVDRLFGFIEEIKGSSDRYLVVSTKTEIIINIYNKLWKFIENKIISDDSNNKIKEYYKLRFDSDLYLPLETLIEFHSLIINVSCVIEKDNEYYPEIYLDACS